MSHLPSKIYLFKTHPINKSNLIQALLLQGNIGLFMDACSYTFTNELFHCHIGQFVNSCVSLVKNADFRDINWKTILPHLEKYYKAACLEHKSLVLGANSNQQIAFLKSYFKDNLVTIGINYTNNSYHANLQNIAYHHIYRLHHHQITASEYDNVILSTLSKKEQLNHYTTEFDKLSLIPTSSLCDCDVNIDMNEFNNATTITNLFSDLCLSYDTKLYKRWTLTQ